MYSTIRPKANLPNKKFPPRKINDRIIRQGVHARDSLIACLLVKEDASEPSCSKLREIAVPTLRVKLSLPLFSDRSSKEIASLKELYGFS